eukprot:COSAG02_NODE_1463_length_12488_cov_7.312591_10_plen_190_part_00
MKAGEIALAGPHTCYSPRDSVLKRTESRGGRSRPTLTRPLSHHDSSPSATPPASQSRGCSRASPRTGAFRPHAWEAQEDDEGGTGRYCRRGYPRLCERRSPRVVLPCAEGTGAWPPNICVQLVLAVATAGSVPLSTLVVGAEASYASTPRGVRVSGQATELGNWQRARKDGDQLRTLQSRKSQYCSQYS